MGLRRYRKRIKNINWDTLYKSDDISLSYNIFETNILDILDKEAPMTTIQIRNNHKSWVSSATKLEIKRRDSAREMARLSQDPVHWGIYRQMRNACTTSLRKDQKEYHKIFYMRYETENDIGSLYKLTKHQLGWGGGGGSPESFIIDGQRVSAPTKMANIQLDHFTEKINKITRRLRDNMGDPHKTLKLALERWGALAAQRPKFQLREISLSETCLPNPQIRELSIIWSRQTRLHVYQNCGGRFTGANKLSHKPIHIQEKVC